MGQGGGMRRCSSFTENIQMTVIQKAFTHMLCGTLDTLDPVWFQVSFHSTSQEIVLAQRFGSEQFPSTSSLYAKLSSTAQVLIPGFILDPVLI